MAFLKVTSGKLKGEKFTVDRDEITIGRAPDNVVCLDDPSISGKHCSISRKGRRYTLTDLGSTNGTRLNGVRVSSYRLSAKDVVAAGSVELLFDGNDIEDERIAQVPPTIVKEPTRARVEPADDLGSGIPAFTRKKSSKGMWIVITAVAGIFAVVALVWFLRNLFAS